MIEMSDYTNHYDYDGLYHKHIRFASIMNYDGSIQSPCRAKLSTPPSILLNFGCIPTVSPKANIWSVPSNGYNLWHDHYATDGGGVMMVMVMGWANTHVLIGRPGFSFEQTQRFPVELPSIPHIHPYSPYLEIFWW